MDTGLVAAFDGRHYLSELGMKRAANMSRVLPGVIRRRHGAYLDRWYREHEQTHNDGVNRLVARFAREGAEVVAGWRGEVNIPGLTQVRPDLLVQVSEGPFGAGTHYIEFERSAVSPQDVNDKLGPYRRTAAAGRPLPLLVVCETGRGQVNFRAAGGTLPMLTATLECRPCSTAGDYGNRPVGPERKRAGPHKARIPRRSGCRGGGSAGRPFVPSDGQPPIAGCGPSSPALRE